MRAAAAIGVVLAMTSCGKPEATAVAVPLDAEVADVDIAVAGELDAQPVLDSDATAPKDQLDLGSGDTDAETDDAGDAQAVGLDAVPLPKLPTICVQEPLIAPPSAGAPCKTPGERRCTDTGATYFIGPDAMCVRPNLLECIKTASVTSWVQRSCNEVQKASVGAALWDLCHYYKSVCVESASAGAICVHVGLLSEEMAKIGDPKVPIAQLCRPDNVGKVRCLNGGEEGQCQKLQGGKFQGPLQRLLTEGYPLDYCSPLGEGGTYNVATKWCPVEFLNCPNEPGTIYKGKCRLHSDGKQRCDQNCEEAKESGPPFKTP